MSKASFDYVIVGSGIVGLTVATEIARRSPKSSIAILEKEPKPGAHASGRNSGVMHCGIYYGSETTKAKVCAEGARRMIEFAEAEGVAVNRCGKVILATSESQLPTVDKLMRNATENNIRAERIDNKTLAEIEPYAAEAYAAIYCPSTAVIDSTSVLEVLRSKLESQGVTFYFNCEFKEKINDHELRTSIGLIGYGFLVNCAGAYADEIAKAYELATDYALVPFKGTYWKLSPESNHKVRANIYPVPDVSMPFLGVHLTRVISGDVYVGPTSIPALGRENYGLLSGISLLESISVGYQISRMYLKNENNFRKLAHQELGKYNKNNFLKSAQKLMPSLTLGEMVATPKVGIRPQLVNVRTKKLEMDYILEQTKSSLHVLNAISPAFTGSLTFADMIVDRIGV